MNEKTETERLIALIEKLVDENAWLYRELAKRQTVTTNNGITLPHATPPTITLPWTVTCTGDDHKVMCTDGDVS